MDNIGPKNLTPEFGPKIRGSKIRIPHEVQNPFCGNLPLMFYCKKGFEKGCRKGFLEGVSRRCWKTPLESMTSDLRLAQSRCSLSAQMEATPYITHCLIWGVLCYHAKPELSDPTEIPPYRERGVAIPLSHCVSCGIADYRCYTPTSVRKSGLLQSKDRPNKGVSQKKLASEAYRVIGGVARNSIANRAIVGH